MVDHSTPQFCTEHETTQKVGQSVISLACLIHGQVRHDQIERAFSPQGCGAVLIKLDRDHAAMYDVFYRLQWQLGTRALDQDPELKKAAISKFASLDLPVRQLLLRCAVGVARIRRGIAPPGLFLPQPEVKRFGLAAPLSAALGRPWFANRQEFHPSVEWLIAQEKRGCLRRNESTQSGFVAILRDYARIQGRVQADEVRLLELYREWKSSSFEERKGHGNKYNGDVYYGAFRGRTHVDSGGTMTVLFGGGELRDRDGRIVDGATSSRELGGTLSVASPGENNFVSLPYRLKCGSPYVVVFFEEFDNRILPPGASTFEESPGSAGRKSVVGREVHRATALNTGALGWAGTVHGVSRIENERFSRGQAVVHVALTEDDVA